jgi:hypothetical protein
MPAEYMHVPGNPLVPLLVWVTNGPTAWMRASKDPIERRICFGNLLSEGVSTQESRHG